MKTCTQHLEDAQTHLDAANANIPSLSNGLRAALPTCLVCGYHLANSYLSALMALTVGTMVNP